MLRHIDCIAVSIIALGLLALSHAAPILRIPADSVRVESINAQRSEDSACKQLFSRLDHLLNH